jgi:integrase/recombinase XerD
VRDDLFPKVPHKLPIVLSQEEVVRLIDAAPNRLYRMILVLLYGTGVRRTEAARIKVEDIDSQRMLIHIRQGKGARDRDVPLSPKLLVELRGYWQRKSRADTEYDAERWSDLDTDSRIRTRCSSRVTLP